MYYSKCCQFGRVVLDKFMKNWNVLYAYIALPGGARNWSLPLKTVSKLPTHTVASDSWCSTFPGIFAGDRTVFKRKGSICWGKIWGQGNFYCPSRDTGNCFCVLAMITYYPRNTL